MFTDASPSSRNLLHVETSPSILLVDDDAELGEIISTILEQDGFQVTQARSIREALAVLRHGFPHLIITDLRLPDGHGMEFIRYVRQMPNGKAVPILVLSALVDTQTVRQVRHAGADEYLTKPFNPGELTAIVRNSLQRKRAVETLATREAHLQTVIMLANTIEARDMYTRGHVERVKDYALHLAQLLGWSDEELAILEFGAILHDIGKIAIPEHILNKPGPLTKDELEIMQSHPQRGADMLRQVAHLQPAIPYVLYHHERWNGNGYPYGLKGNEIPPQGRLLAIVDAYDAMTTDRPYHRALPPEAALKEIQDNAGILFDPQMARVFVQMIQEDLKRNKNY